MVAKVHRLDEDARWSPLLCAKRLVESIESGDVKPRRMIVILEAGTPDAPAFYLAASGPGMDYVPTTIGLLHMAITDLELSTRDDDG